ncbi:MAG: response regulator [Candidatus Zixiibacteriota bacterium]|nr:MAG: response regulator [candidate division Zixibacteria bacterium]
MTQEILAIDDELHMLRLLERIITDKTPYRVETLNNSLELPAFLKDREFDLIITDLKMPGMDGLDILKFIKENKRFEEVIIITAFGSLDSATEALSSGVFDYITKPFRKEEIINTINRAMLWQECKKETCKLNSFFESEPLSEAIDKFRAEYIRRMLDKYDNSIEKTSQHSGLSIDEIRGITG